MDKARIEKTAKALKNHGFEVYTVKNSDQVCQKVREILPKGARVSFGGSMSIIESGVLELLENGDYELIDRRKAKTPEELKSIYNDAYSADAFFCSTNAVTEDGFLYNVDGNANRVSMISFGPSTVIMIVGVNKIVKDIGEAVIRVKKTAAPKNAKRLGLNTYCALNGECVALGSGQVTMCNGCGAICSQHLISGKQKHIGRIKIILVEEPLGF